MSFAYKIPKRTEEGCELCISEGSEYFWKNSDLVGGTTVISWE